jgi:hypothetical protein
MNIRSDSTNQTVTVTILPLDNPLKWQAPDAEPLDAAMTLAAATEDSSQRSGALLGGVVGAAASALVHMTPLPIAPRLGVSAAMVGIGALAGSMIGTNTARAANVAAAPTYQSLELPHGIAYFTPGGAESGSDVVNVRGRTSGGTLVEFARSVDDPDTSFDAATPTIADAISKATDTLASGRMSGALDEQSAFIIREESPGQLRSDLMRLERGTQQTDDAEPFVVTHDPRVRAIVDGSGIYHVVDPSK